MELDDELRGYVDLLSDDTTPGVTRPRRRVAPHGRGRRHRAIKEQVRDARSGAWLDTLWQDVRFGVWLLSTIPIVSRRDRLAGARHRRQQRGLRIAERAAASQPCRSPRAGARRNSPGRTALLPPHRPQPPGVPPLWNEIRAEQEAFTALFAFADTRFNLAPQGEVRYVEGLFVSGKFFPVLGVPAALGRAIGPEDDRPGCGAGSAVISHALWQREFGGTADILSRTRPSSQGTDPIIGVMPAGFFGVEVGRRFDVALPLCASGFNGRITGGSP